MLLAYYYVEALPAATANSADGVPYALVTAYSPARALVQFMLHFALPYRTGELPRVGQVVWCGDDETVERVLPSDAWPFNWRVTDFRGFFPLETPTSTLERVELERAAQRYVQHEQRPDFRRDLGRLANALGAFAQTLPTIPLYGGCTWALLAASGRLASYVTDCTEGDDAAAYRAVEGDAATTRHLANMLQTCFNPQAIRESEPGQPPRSPNVDTAFADVLLAVLDVAYSFGLSPERALLDAFDAKLVEETA